MFKEMLMRKLIKSQLGGKILDNPIDKLVALVTENPQFFQTVAEEVKRKTDNGINQQEAVMQVIKSHETEFKSLQDKFK
ncbi:MAG: hypothetical protein WC764_00130 [Candidatus Paceibacterota bacterium]|jgi:hypothetical protein